jgi:hypothetical protein
MWMVANYYYRNPTEREVETRTSGTIPLHGNSFLSREIKKNYNTDRIYPGLTVKNEEIKIIADAYIYIDTGFKKPDGNFVDPRVRGFFIVNPEYTGTEIKRGYFHTIVIFTPKPGLFSETVPG